MPAGENLAAQPDVADEERGELRLSHRIQEPASIRLDTVARIGGQPPGGSTSPKGVGRVTAEQTGGSLTECLKLFDAAVPLSSGILATKEWRSHQYLVKLSSRTPGRGQPSTTSACDDA